MMDPWGSKDEGQNLAPQNENGPINRSTSTAPIVITEVTTTRTITINEDADLSDANVAQLVAQFKAQQVLSPQPQAQQISSSPTPSSASTIPLGLGAYYVPPTNPGGGGESEDFYYISDEEGLKPSHSGGTRQQRFNKHPTERSTKKESSHHHGPHSSSSRSPKNGGWSPPRSSSPSAAKPSRKDEILSPLGPFSEIDATSEVAKMIKLYAKNSISKSSKRGDSGGPRIKVKGIYKKDGLLPKVFSAAGSVKKSEQKKKKTTFAGGNDLTMLLWFKTSPDSVRKLANGKDSCTAFYDRISRALPKQINDNLRQIILLCKVNLGNVYKSPHGYSHWHKTPSHPPKGCDSVKGVGKFRPNWTKNLNHKSTLVPVGETEKSTRFNHFEIDFNEYMVFSSDKIKVKYAVDIEIIHGSKEHANKIHK